MASLDPSADTSVPESVPVAPPSTTATLQPVLKIGTRKSLLARVQTDLVVAMLKKHNPTLETHIEAISTMGDKNQVTALHAFDAKSLWTFELEAMLAKGEVDLIVHSLKDIPTQLAPEFTIGAVPERGDPRDALVLHPALPPTTTLSQLPENATVGTSSVRRSAQLKRLYPHLRFQSVRGNVQTRLRKLDESDLALSSAAHGSSGTKQGDAATVAEDDHAGTQVHYSALILAAAGLQRLGLGERINRLFAADISEQTKDGLVKKGMLHAVGQGALGVQARANDPRILALLAPLNDAPTRLATMAERSLMRTLEGGCSVPIGVETEWSLRRDALTMRAIVVALDGLQACETEMTRAVASEEEALQFGMDVAARLVELGAKDILEKITLNRKIIEDDKGA